MQVRKKVYQLPPNLHNLAANKLATKNPKKKRDTKCNRILTSLTNKANQSKDPLAGFACRVLVTNQNSISAAKPAGPLKSKFAIDARNEVSCLKSEFPRLRNRPF